MASAFLCDGYGTTIAFGTTDSTEYRIVGITPPGMSAGGAIDTTTFSNSNVRTMKPKALYTMTDASMTISYDPTLYDDLKTMVGLNQAITLTFSDLTPLVFWGWIDSFEPGEMTEGEFPTGDITIIPSNLDGADAEIELTAVAP